MRKFLFIALAAALFTLLFSVVCGIFAPAIDRMLLWPGFRLSRALGISEESVGNYLVAGIGFAWLLWAAILAAVVAVIEKTIWRRKRLFVACGVVACAILLFEARGKHNEEYQGTWEVGFEQSNFYDHGGCWRTPYWLEPTPELSSRFAALGNPRAVKVKFVGDTTSIGEYGHLGQYLRSIRVVRVIDVEAAQPCQP
jgi:hypothetical protein